MNRREQAEALLEKVWSCTTIDNTGDTCPEAAITAIEAALEACVEECAKTVDKLSDHFVVAKQLPTMEQPILFAEAMKELAAAIRQGVK